MMVDDDNEPAPENVPDLAQETAGARNVQAELYFGQSWEWNGFDEQKKDNFVKIQPKINSLSGTALDGDFLLRCYFYFS